jgi:hypothetical protein
MDPIEPELLDELLQGNVVVVVHEDGDVSVLMNEKKVAQNPKQLEMSMRMMLCSDPSFMLKSVLLIEGFFHYLWGFFSKND